VIKVVLSGYLTSSCPDLTGLACSRIDVPARAAEMVHPSPPSQVYTGPAAFEDMPQAVNEVHPGTLHEIRAAEIELAATGGGGGARSWTWRPLWTSDAVELLQTQWVANFGAKSVKKKDAPAVEWLMARSVRTVNTYMSRNRIALVALAALAAAARAANALTLVAV